MHSSPPETRASLILRLPDAKDVAAWNEVTAIYTPLIRRLARFRGLQPNDVDDLTQEVLASLARSVAAWLDRPDRGSFRAWLLSIARNKAINHLTRRSTRPWALGGDEAAELIAELPGRNDEITCEFDMEYRREVFHWAVSQVRRQVSETTWAAFQLTHIDGQSIPQTAQQLGTTVGTVYVSRSRVMKRIQEFTKQFEAPQ
jgi:RNA polymerase sigma-70 factor, ECF subfamily